MILKNKTNRNKKTVNSFVFNKISTIKKKINLERIKFEEKIDEEKKKFLFVQKT